MGVNLCTRPMMKEESQAIMLKVDEREFRANSSIFSVLQDSITLKYLHQEEYKVSD